MKTAVASADNWSGAKRSMFALIRMAIENAQRLR